MDLVSIIIPVYGVEQYLDRCVRSVVNQSYPQRRAGRGNWRVHRIRGQ